MYCDPPYAAVYRDLDTDEPPIAVFFDSEAADEFVINFDDGNDDNSPYWIEYNPDEDE